MRARGFSRVALGDGPARVEDGFVTLARVARKVLARPDGPRVAALEAGRLGHARPAGAAGGTRGTDHGAGSVALPRGRAVAGGRVRADWPGLGLGRLFEDRDLAPPPISAPSPRVGWHSISACRPTRFRWCSPTVPASCRCPD
ncbi:MAG TPA: hypothetical protein VJ779_17770 [Acetobacteraceae bacterium]|nr:hypothetical protein [Acetobacteraceae bacterium]